MPTAPGPWTLFNWGSRGPWYTTGVEGIYMAHLFFQNGIRAVLQAESTTGQQLLHVFHFRSPNASPDYADCLAVGDVVGTWWNSNYRHMVTSAITGRQVVATGMDAVPAAQATILLTLAGDRSGSLAPAEISLALKFFTHISGRRNHGGARGFPPVAADYTADRFTPGYVTAMLGVFQNLINAANAGGYPLVIASMADVALKTISGVIAVDDIIDSQRRRMTGRGR